MNRAAFAATPASTSPVAPSLGHHVTQEFLPKVPAITLTFWMVKTLTTGTGEAFSDYLAHVPHVIAGLVLMVGFFGSMWLQLRATSYSAPVYWLAVSMIAVSGTVAADIVHKGAGLPYWASTILYSLVVAGLFVWWKRSEGTVSIHSIVTKRRELFYWAMVLATFALGTAAGDFTAAGVNLGYFGSILLFAAVMLVAAICWQRRWMPEVAVFWFAYIVTRPLGASIADWIGKPHARTGLGFGDGHVSIVAGAAIVALVVWLTVTKRDVQHWAIVDPDAPPVPEP